MSLIVDVFILFPSCTKQQNSHFLMLRLLGKKYSNETSNSEIFLILQLLLRPKLTPKIQTEESLCTSFAFPSLHGNHDLSYRGNSAWIYYLGPFQREFLWILKASHYLGKGNSVERAP